MSKPHDCPHCNLVYYSKGALTRHIKDEHGGEPLDLSERFMQKYFNLDGDFRKHIVLQFRGEPYTWNPIWVEVCNKTKLGNLMLEQMAKEGTI